MSNFTLLSITMPGQYVVMSAILKPFVSLNIFRTYIGLHETHELAENISEEELAYLG
jgi:hypothetical protein